MDIELGIRRPPPPPPPTPPPTPIQERLKLPETTPAHDIYTHCGTVCPRIPRAVHRSTVCLGHGAYHAICHCLVPCLQSRWTWWRAAYFVFMATGMAFVTNKIVRLEGLVLDLIETQAEQFANLST